MKNAADIAEQRERAQRQTCEAALIATLKFFDECKAPVEDDPMRSLADIAVDVLVEHRPILLEKLKLARRK